MTTKVEGRVLGAQQSIQSSYKTNLPSRPPLPQGNFLYERCRTDPSSQAASSAKDHRQWHADGVRQTLIGDFKFKYDMMYGVHCERGPQGQPSPMLLTSALGGVGGVTPAQVSEGLATEEAKRYQPHTTPDVLRSLAPSGAKRYTTPATPRDPFARGHFGNIWNYTRARRSAEVIKFSKLPPYTWQSAVQVSQLPHVAPDTPYKNTYGTPNSSKGKFKLTMPRIPCKKYGTTATFLSRDPASETIIQETFDTSRREKSPSRPSSNAANSRRIMDRLQQIQNLDEPILEIRPHHPGSTHKGTSAGSRQRHPESEGMLYTEVKQSIKLFKQLQDRLNHHVQTMLPERPLKRENGRYRPFSKTYLHTPTLVKSPIPAPDPDSKQYKSADTYLVYVEKAKTMPNLKSPPATATRPSTLPVCRGSVDLARAPATSRPLTGFSLDTTVSTRSKGKDPPFQVVSSTLKMPRSSPTNMVALPVSEATCDGNFQDYSEQAKEKGNSLPSWADADVPSGELKEDMTPDSGSVGSKREVLTVDVPSVGEDVDEEERE